MNKLTKKVIALLLAVCVAAGFVSCGGADENKASGGEPIVLTDHLGREVTLDKPAETVVSSYYISTTTLIALGAEDQLVGVEMKAEKRPIYKLAAPQILDLPAMGNKKNFNMEECAKLNPDLVILPMGLKDYVAQLEELNIPVLVVNPETKEAFDELVMMLGEATGHTDRASALGDYFDGVCAEVSERLEGADGEKSVYFGSADDVLRSATAEMYQNDLIHYAGGKAVFGDLTEKGWTAVSAETLSAYNPEYIFVENMGDESAEALMNDPAFASLTAVKDGNVFAFPSKIETWDTPSPSNMLGIYWMSSVLYPDVISMDEVRDKAAEFYKEFFDIEVTAEQLGI